MTRKFWTDLWFLLLYIGGGLVLTMIVMVGLMALIGNQPLALHLAQWAQNVLAFLLPACLWVKYYKKERLREVMHFEWPGWTMMALTVLLMLASLPLMNRLCEWCEQMPMPQWLYDYGMAMKEQQDPVMEQLLAVGGVGGWIAVIMLMCVMTGLAEEVVFRGALLRCFVRPTSMPANGERTLHAGNLWWVALVIGLIFAAIHFEVFGFLPRTVLGGLFVWLVWRASSIWPAVLAHAINNLVALVSMKNEAPLWLEELWEADWLVVVSLALTAVVVWLMVKARPQRS